MALAPDDIAALSALLDEALALDAAAREAWLAALPPAQQAQVPRLRRMLARHDGDAPDDRLLALPALDADDTTARAGDRVGAYCLVREIGRGGMGSVWLAERADGSFRRNVALKLPRLSWGAGLAERMARERAIGAMLEHPHIARLYDAGVDERGRPFIAMACIDGQQIDAYCRDHALGTRARLALFMQVVQAVAYAHGRLVIHRDLKPANVLVDAQGQAHLLDFGIAKLADDATAQGANLTEEQGRVMTPHYAAPEQIAGEHVGVPADIYSLGVMLHELLTAQRPHDARRATRGAIEQAILESEPPLASTRAADRATRRELRGDVDAILAKALRREPARRYASAESLANDIERHLSGQTISACADSPLYRLRKTARRHWVGFSAIAAVLAAVLAGSAVAVVQARHAASSAERERVVKDFVAEIFRMNVEADDGVDAPKQYTAEQLLARGAQLIDSRFPRQPELQAELFGVVGDVYEQMGAYRLAADFDERQLAVMAGFQPGRDERARVLLRLAEALLQDKDTVAARRFAGQALAAAHGEAPLAYDALVMVMRCQKQAGQRQQVIETLQQVKRLAATTPVPDRASHAWALDIEAELAEDNDRWADAKPLYDRAIAVAVLAEGPNSLVAAQIRHRVAGELMSLNRFDEADPYEEASLAALRHYGQTGQVRMLRQVADVQYIRGEYSVASSVETAGRIAELLDKARRSHVAIPAEDLGVIELELVEMDELGGNVADAAERVGRLEPLFRSTPNAGLRAFWINQAASVAEMTGRNDVAEGLLRQRRRLRVETGDGGVEFAVVDAVAIGENLIQQGKLDEADAFLSSLPPFEAVHGDPKQGESYAHLVDIARAHVRLERGDAAGALRLLAQHGERWSEDGSDAASPERNVNMVGGLAWCRLGQFERAQALLGRVLDERAAYAFPQDPGLAWARAQAGRCALQAGERARALALASLARAAFDRQPGVSPYFKAPLIELEKALGTGGAAVAAPAATTRATRVARATPTA